MSAGVAELADAPDLGSGVPDVQVQVLSPASIAAESVDLSMIQQFSFCSELFYKSF